MRIPFKFMGRIPDDDPFHQVGPITPLGMGPPPRCVNIPGVGCVPQYAPTVFGDHDGFDPAHDCQGYFTLLKFQAHNNCYAYALDIASNSMAQPGRRHGIKHSGDFQTDQIIKGCELDGLKLLGGPGLSLDDALDKAEDLGDGTLIAFLLAPPDHTVSIPGSPNGFPGDFHFVRCDDLESSEWSQKPGDGQVTNLDFAGEPITDPTSANWRLNAGGILQGGADFLTAYQFQAWMFVPGEGINII